MVESSTVSKCSTLHQKRQPSPIELRTKLRPVLGATINGFQWHAQDKFCAWARTQRGLTSVARRTSTSNTQKVHVFILKIKFLLRQAGSMTVPMLLWQKSAWKDRCECTSAQVYLQKLIILLLVRNLTDLTSYLCSFMPWKMVIILSGWPRCQLGLLHTKQLLNSAPKQSLGRTSLSCRFLAILGN